MMTKTSKSFRAWNLPSDVSLADAVAAVRVFCEPNRLLLATRRDRDSSIWEPLFPSAFEVAERLAASRLIRRAEARGWPGTELVGHTGLVWLVRFDSSLLRAMEELGPRLADWVGDNSPSLPEDICLFREGDPLPSLVSITHEKQAWIIHEHPIPLGSVHSVEVSADSLLIPAALSDFISE
jgi:hypothetical protein